MINKLFVTANGRAGVLSRQVRVFHSIVRANQVQRAKPDLQFVSTHARCFTQKNDKEPVEPKESTDSKESEPKKPQTLME